jgi:hypothetical protein
MAKKQKRAFRCDHCKSSKRFKNAMQLARHFSDNPDHRNHRQQVQFEYSQSVRDKRGRKRNGLFSETTTALPTVAVDLRGRSGKMKAVRTMKHCTDCGAQRKATHRFCGGCGEKLS